MEKSGDKTNVIKVDIPCFITSASSVQSKRLYFKLHFKPIKEVIIKDSAKIINMNIK